MADIANDIYRAEGVSVPYYVCQLTLRNFLEMQACLLEGAYHSAARSLRWLYEVNVIGATAIIEPSLLDNRYPSKSRLDLAKFEVLLERCDTGEVKIGRGKRKRIFDNFSLPSADLASLYSSLCKYIHLSKLSFDKKLDFPNLQYISEKFDDIFKLIVLTLDLVFWMQSKMCLCFNSGTAKALKYFLKDTDRLNVHIPMTVSLISSLAFS